MVLILKFEFLMNTGRQLSSSFNNTALMLIRLDSYLDLLAP